MQHNLGTIKTAQEYSGRKLWNSQHKSHFLVLNSLELLYSNKFGQLGRHEVIFRDKWESPYERRRFGDNEARYTDLNSVKLKLPRAGTLKRQSTRSRLVSDFGQAGLRDPFGKTLISYTKMRSSLANRDWDNHRLNRKVKIEPNLQFFEEIPEALPVAEA